MNWYKISQGAQSAQIIEVIGPLYHGTPYKFDKKVLKYNRDNVIFFSDDYDFAYNYASQKSFEAKMDADIVVITAYITGSVFNPENESNVSAVIPYLPEKIIVYNDFGMSANLSLDRWRYYLSGEHIDPPKFSDNDLIGKKAGDPLPDHEVYNSPMSYQVISITSDYVYYCLIGEIQSVMYQRYAIPSPHLVGVKLPKYSAEEVANGLMNFSGLEFKKKFNDLGRHYDIGIMKASRHESKTVDNDTWRWLEGDGVFEAIHGGGFDIIKGRERGKNTYAVFSSAKIDVK